MISSFGILDLSFCPFRLVESLRFYFLVRSLVSVSVPEGLSSCLSGNKVCRGDYHDRLQNFIAFSILSLFVLFMFPFYFPLFPAPIPNSISFDNFPV